MNAQEFLEHWEQGEQAMRNITEGDIPIIPYWTNVGSMVLSDNETIAQAASIRDAEEIAFNRNDQIKDILLKWPRPKVTGCGSAK